MFPTQTNDMPMKIASRNDETGNIVISKREYLFDVFSPTTPATFNINKFQANPGLGGLGPFIGQIAGNYDKYRYRRLVLSFNPVVTDSSSTGQMGTVLMAFHPNAGAQVFQTKQQMAEYDGGISGKVCESIVLGAECDSRKAASNWLFVRTGSVPSGEDIKTYDSGAFMIATSGISATSFPAGTQLGEVWIDYEVELSSPKLWDAMGFSNLCDNFVSTGVGATIARPLGSAPRKSANNSLGGTLNKVDNNYYILPDNFQGWIRVTFEAEGTGFTGNVGVATQGNITAVLDFASTGANGGFLRASSATASVLVADYKVDFATTAGGNFLVLSIGNFTTVTCSNLRVDMYNSRPGPPYGTTSNYIDV